MPNNMGTAAEIEKRLNEGAWLKPGEVGVLFGKSRWSAINWMTGKGVKLGSTYHRLRWKYSTGGHRIVNPDDVRAALKIFRDLQRPADSDGTTEQ